MLVVVFITLTGNFQDRLQLIQCEHREVARKQQEECEEYADRSNEHTNINRSSLEFSPCCRKVIAVNGGNDDYETLKPHTDIYDDRHEECEAEVRSQFLEPEELRRDHIARHHAPV